MTATLGILAPGLLLAILERSPRRRLRPRPFFRAYFLTDVVHLAIGWIAGAAFAIGYVVAASAVFRRLGVPRLDVPWWLAVPVAVVLLDGGNYLAHWLLHRVDVLWAFHKVHHSSRSLDWLATYRSHVVEQAFRRLVSPVFLIVIGIPVDAVVVAAAVFTAWATFNHSNLRARLGALDRVLVTPGFHRVHHVPATSARNLGTVFTLWDAWRGTLERATPAVDAEMGVPLEVQTYPQDWGRQLVEPLRISRRERRSACQVHAAWGPISRSSF